MEAQKPRTFGKTRGRLVLKKDQGFSDRVLGCEGAKLVGRLIRRPGTDRKPKESLIKQPANGQKAYSEPTEKLRRAAGKPTSTTLLDEAKMKRRSQSTYTKQVKA
jgi:hypothetical protein